VLTVADASTEESGLGVGTRGSPEREVKRAIR
jgi:hypothetical protein